MFKKIIEFKSEYEDILPHPVPIKKLVPDWYKKLPNYNDEIKNYQNPTAKKCIPLLDAFTSGYAIINPIEFVFWHDTVDGEKGIQWRFADSLDLNLYPRINLGIQTHNVNQINKGFLRDNEIHVAFKYLNPWVIQTPKNYSCLFINPLNHGKERCIRTLDAVVETDTYNTQVNFPFFLKNFDEDKTYVLKKGEPIALVFPFKRDNWKVKVSKLSSKAYTDFNFKFFGNLKDNYKTKIWRKKSYD